MVTMAALSAVPLQEGFEEVIRTPTRLQVAKLLVTHPDREFTGREASRLLGMNHATVSQAMRHLSDVGLVYDRVVGRAIVHRLNKDSYLRDSVRDLLKLESGFADEMEEAIRKGLRDVAVSLVVFGSYARGEATRHSDLDLLVVSDDPARVEARLAGLQGDFIRAFGVLLSPKIVSRADLSKKALPPYLSSAIKEGLSITGPPLRDLV